MATIFPVMTDGTYRVTFSPEAMAALQRNEVSFKYGYAVLRDHKGRIFKHPEFVNSISPAQIANLAFNIGSMIFAQQHLANIKEDLQKIMKWQENTDISALTGRISWLKETLFKSLEEKGNNSEWLAYIKNELFHSQNNMHDIQEKLILEADEIKNKADKIFIDDKISKEFDNEIFGTKSAYKKLSRLNEDIVSFNKKYDILVRTVIYMNLAIKLIDSQLNAFHFFRLKSDLYDKVKESLDKMKRASKIIFSTDYKSKQNIALCTVVPIIAPFRIGHHLMFENKRQEEIENDILRNIDKIHNSRKLFRDYSKNIKEISTLPQDMIIEVNHTGKIISGKILLSKDFDGMS